MHVNISWYSYPQNPKPLNPHTHTHVHTHTRPDSPIMCTHTNMSSCVERKYYALPKVFIGCATLLQVDRFMSARHALYTWYYPIEASRFSCSRGQATSTWRCRSKCWSCSVGRGRVTEACREAGRSCIAYDSLYDPSGAAMNFLSDGGWFCARSSVSCVATTMPACFHCHSHKLPSCYVHCI